MEKEKPPLPHEALQRGNLSAARQPDQPLSPQQQASLAPHLVLDIAQARRLGITTDQPVFGDAIYRGTPITWQGRRGLFVGLHPSRREPLIAEDEAQLAAMGAYFDQTLTARRTPLAVLASAIAQGLRSPVPLLILLGLGLLPLLMALQLPSPALALVLITAALIGGLWRFGQTHTSDREQ